ncbi:MAG: SDR family NAD(P)-dependent oxidoreductase [Alphaproteobacteria bacterium]|nr:SDR family NAD(P)-dependent oxidoreductase [Alphaproteobacteria bacterium]
MKGKSVVIAGAASGLGLATARMAAERGARVALVDQNKNELALVVAELEKQGHEVLAIPGDIYGQENSLTLFGEAVRAFDRVHGLVNCVGIYPRVALFEISEEDWWWSFLVNVMGTHFMMIAAANHMRAQSGGERILGRIVNVTSVDAHIAEPKHAHHAAMKAAVASLTKSFALELAPAQILINAVAPSGISTERAKASGWLPQMETEIPVGRIAKPEDIADVILFLLSSQNRYVSGENVIVSGAYTIV